MRVVLFITQWAPTSVWETTRWSNIPSLAKLINKWQWMNQWIILTISHINVYLLCLPSSRFSCFFQWRQLHIDTQYWESQRVRHVIVLCLLFLLFCFIMISNDQYGQYNNNFNGQRSTINQHWHLIKFYFHICLHELA